MRVFVNFEIDAYDLPLAVESIRKAYPQARNLFARNGEGIFFQEMRKCPDCGSHLFRDDIEQRLDKVECFRCGKLLDIQ
jgi:ribosomal protein S27AE